MTKEERLQILNLVFSPITPIKRRDLFFGRRLQLEQVVDAINETGQHAILHGERGVGKTSLANIMFDSYTNLYPVKITCNREDEFRTLWERAFSEVQFSQTTKGIGFNPQEKQTIINIGNQLRGIEIVTPDIVEKLLRQLNGSKFLFIFDEFDNIRTKKIRSSFADLIKSLSDNVANTTIVLVGIGENVEELIGAHQSLERCLKQVKMPRMSDDEAGAIIDNGLSLLGISIPVKVKNSILEFSSGFPHYIHLLCKYGAKEIIMNEKNEFSEAYLKIAIKNGIDNTSEQLRSSYQKATLDSKIDSKWTKVLNACANSKSDKFNCFSTSDILSEYNKLSSKSVKGVNITYNLNQLCGKERGEILCKIGSGVNTKYRFINPMMRAFVKLKINSN
jgi:Cdc6-like AAA superfamily ATPase